MFNRNNKTHNIRVNLRTSVGIYLFWQLNDRLFFILPIDTEGLADRLYFFSFALAAYFFNRLLACVAVIYRQFYLDELVMIKRYIEFVQYRFS